MFSAFGRDVHDKFGQLLRNESIWDISRTGDFAEVKTRYYEGNYAKEDILIAIWELYNFCVSQMITGAWLREWQQAPNRSKFIYSEKTREPLYNELIEANKIFKDRMLIRKWTAGFNEAGSAEEYVRRILA